MVSNQLVVITQLDLSLFGCPHCSSGRGSRLITFSKCFLWACDFCEEESAIVQKKLAELMTIDIKNTEVQDLIGKHPFKDVSIKIPIFNLNEKQNNSARVN